MQLGYSRNTDPITSHAAADRIDGKIPNLNKQVLQCLEDNKRAGGTGLTSKEIAEGLGLAHVTVSPRMKPLEVRRMVVRTDRHRDKSIVWEVV